MAQASCGMHFSWDCPLWCSGKKNENGKVEMECIKCPWYKGNNKNNLYEN